MTERADPLAPSPYRVVATTVDAPDVATLTLAPTDSPLGSVRPGQFVMAWTPGVGEIPLSVSGLHPGGVIELTVRTVGATSRALTERVAGASVGLRGPYGTAWPLDLAPGRDVLVAAGGLGLAPLRLALESLVAGLGSADPGPASLTLVVGAREPAQVVYGADLARWRRAGARVVVTVDAADRTWGGAVGTATAAIRRDDRPHDLAFVCGPELMMSTAARALVETGTPPDAVYVSLERNMHCGVAHCGRCQLGSLLLCRDGAVVPWTRVETLMEVRAR